jgi:hypothetical protein
MNKGTIFENFDLENYQEEFHKLINREIIQELYGSFTFPDQKFDI